MFFARAFETPTERLQHQPDTENPNVHPAATNCPIKCEWKRGDQLNTNVRQSTENQTNLQFESAVAAGGGVTQTGVSRYPSRKSVWRTLLCAFGLREPMGLRRLRLKSSRPGSSVPAMANLCSVRSRAMPPPLAKSVRPRSPELYKILG